MAPYESSAILEAIRFPKPSEAICQNPTCNDMFMSEDDELFCPVCERDLPELTKSNIRYAIDHDLMPDKVLMHIMNGETR